MQAAAAAGARRGGSAKLVHVPDAPVTTVHVHIRDDADSPAPREPATPDDADAAGPPMSVSRRPSNAELWLHGFASGPPSAWRSADVSMRERINLLRESPHLRRVYLYILLFTVLLLLWMVLTWGKDHRWVTWCDVSLSVLFCVEVVVRGIAAGRACCNCDTAHTCRRSLWFASDVALAVVLAAMTARNLRDPGHRDRWQAAVLFARYAAQMLRLGCDFARGAPGDDGAYHDNDIVINMSMSSKEQRSFRHIRQETGDYALGETEPLLPSGGGSAVTSGQSSGACTPVWHTPVYTDTQAADASGDPADASRRPRRSRSIADSVLAYADPEDGSALVDSELISFTHHTPRRTG